MDNEKEIDIDLGKIFFMMKRRVVYIILTTLVCAIVSGCVTEFFMTPKYTTSCSMYVSSNGDHAQTYSNIINPNELLASQELAKTYIFVLTSDGFLEKVIEKLELDTTATALRSIISCSQIDEMQIVRVTVTSPDAVMSANVANAIAELAPTELTEKIKAGGVTIIDYAKVPKIPSSPNLKKNVVIGAALGFLLSFAGFFCYELFDTTITSEKDIEREFDVPLLGSIPKLIPAMEKGAADNTDNSSKLTKPKKFSKKGDK